MSRQTTIADIKSKCPAFKDNHCPFTGLKDDFSQSSVFNHGCIVKPGQCKTVGEVTDVLASVLPKDESGKKILAHAVQQAVLLCYNEEKTFGEKCPVVHSHWPFNTDKDGKPVIGPQSAVDSVYVTMDEIKAKCPVFEKGKACPYNVPSLKGLAAGCPEFKDGCPFKGVKDVGEFRDKMGKMRDHCKGRDKYNKAFEIINGVNAEQVAKHGHCPFHQYGCQVKEDLNGKPITTDFMELEYVKEHCPVFQQGRHCPYNIPCLKGLGKGCPEFKNGCPFKDVKTIGEFKAKLGQMRDQCKGTGNYKKALTMIAGVNGAEAAKYGKHCPYFKFGCMLSTDEDDKPIVADDYTMAFIGQHCPAFQKGKFCPYNVPELKGLSKGCPAFKNGCPFKGVKTVGDFKGKLGEMRDVCKGKTKYDEALKIIQSANGKEVAKLGHCPFFKFGCPLSTDREGKPIVPESVTMDYVKTHCPVFEGGAACPYTLEDLKGLGKGCPEFKKNGCPFKDVKTIGEFKAKMGEMRDNCKGKDNYHKALELCYGANGEHVAKHGHCPFFKSGCCLKTDLNGRYVTPDTVTMKYVEQHCPAFEKEKACPYNMPELKGLGKGCPAFKDGCPFKKVKDVGEFQDKLGEMRDQCKGKANNTKAREAVQTLLQTAPTNATVVGNSATGPEHAELACHTRVATGAASIIRVDPSILEPHREAFVTEQPSRENDLLENFVELLQKASVDEAKKIGHCPFHHNHCELKTDRQGKPI